jgi:hypothetical protein
MAVRPDLGWTISSGDVKILEFAAADKAEIPKLLKPIIDDYVKKTSTAGLPA